MAFAMQSLTPTLLADEPVYQTRASAAKDIPSNAVSFSEVSTHAG
jgi:hypothetical protein